MHGPKREIALPPASPTEDNYVFFLKVKKGYTLKNVLSIPLTVLGCSIMMQASITFGINLLIDPAYFNLSMRTVSDLTSELMLRPIPFMLLMLVVGGFMYDRLGKRVTIFSNMVLIAISAFFAPYCNNIYPEYYLDRCLLAMTSLTVMMNPLINVFIKRESRGLAVSYQAFGT
jgi:MFS family permease